MTPSVAFASEYTPLGMYVFTKERVHESLDIF
jgi:hypothetical protein